MKLKIVTITGADDHNNPKQMAELSDKYPFVEWGILYSRSQEGGPRFPSKDWLQTKFATVKRNSSMQTSGHICGKWMRDICKGNWTPFAMEAGAWGQMDRFQINFGSSIIKVDINLFEANLPDPCPTQIILQIDNRPKSIEVYERLKHTGKVAPFYDQSAGIGRLPDKWEPPLSNWQGYAGGLSPANVQHHLTLIDKVVPEDYSIWIDVETHVHTDRVGLDMKAVESFLKATKPWVYSNTNTGG